jgi:hypothetical protein
VIGAVAFPPEFCGVFSFQEMEDKRCFNVGSKSFEMIMDDDGKGMRIIERARNNMSSITLGRDEAHWLQLGMVDLILRSFCQNTENRARCMFFERIEITVVDSSL